MRSYIKCGRFYKLYYYIFISFIFQVVNEAIYGFNYFDNIFDEVKIFHNKGHAYFSKHILIHLFFSYIGLFIFEVPFVIYEVQKYKKINSKKMKDSDLIMDLYKPKITLNKYFLIFLIVFLSIITEYLFIFYTFVLDGLEPWFLELLIICHLGSKMLHLKLYKYEKFVLIINIFPLILKFISIVLSVKLEKETTNLIYIRHIWVIPVGILIYSILALIRSFANLKINKISGSYYPSLNKILMIYGLMGAIITLILCIFTSSFKCNLGEIQDYLCKVSENNNINKYIDSFPIYQNIFHGYSNGDSSQIKFEIFVIIFGGLTFIINKYCFIKVIMYLSPMIFVFSFPILFLFRKIVIIINTLIISKSFYIRDVTGIKKIKFSCDMIGDILSLISFLIFSKLVLINFEEYNSSIRDRDLIYDHPINPGIRTSYFVNEEDDEDEDSLLY